MTFEQAHAEAKRLLAMPRTKEGPGGYVLVQIGEHWTYHPSERGRGLFAARYPGDRSPMRIVSV